jgi:hypothetical protein
MMRITPTSTTKVLIDDEPYLCFKFDPGSVVCPDTALPKLNVLVYAIFDLFFAKGKVPWFLEYNDLVSIFDSAKEFAGTSVGSQPEVVWMLTSLLARDPKDIHRYYRQVVKTPEDLKTKTPIITPLQKVSTAATNTFNRLAGNYMTEGIRSSLLIETKRKERLEKLLTG